jgi:hypothetical protein
VLSSSSCKVILFFFCFPLDVFIQIGKACGDKWKTMTYEVSFSSVRHCMFNLNCVNHKLKFQTLALGNLSNLFRFLMWLND